MARILFLIFLIVIAGLASTSPTLRTQDKSLDFNTLLDGSLGNIPAFWLVSQGTLLELESAARQPAQVAMGDDLAAAATSSALSSPTSDAARTGKEDGIALGAFISAMLIPAAVNVISDGIAGGICKSLAAGAGSMLGAIIAQEAGKAIYPDGYRSNSTASQLEQGIIPGTFIGGIAGGSVGIALSKALCSKLVPDLETLFKEANADTVEKMSKILSRGLTEILTAHLQDIGVNQAKAVNFAHQLETTLKLADKLGMSDAFEFLNREIVSDTSDLTRMVGKGFKATPALDNLVKLSTQTLSLGLPGGSLPFPAASGSIGILQAFTNRHQQLLDFARSVPGASKAVEELYSSTKDLHEATKKAGDLFKSGSSKKALHDLDGAADIIQGRLRDLGPLAHSGHKAGKEKIVHITRTTVFTKEVLRTTIISENPTNTVVKTETIVITTTGATQPKPRTGTITVTVTAQNTCLPNFAAKEPTTTVIKEFESPTVKPECDWKCLLMCGIIFC